MDKNYEKYRGNFVFFYLFSSMFSSDLIWSLADSSSRDFCFWKRFSWICSRSFFHIRTWFFSSRDSASYISCFNYIYKKMVYFSFLIRKLYLFHIEQLLHFTYLDVHFFGFLLVVVEFFFQLFQLFIIIIIVIGIDLELFA